MTVNTPGLRRFRRAIETGGGRVDRAIRQWAVRYRGFLQRRFDQYSKGGGNWPPLSPRTIAGRRGKGINVAILRDTGTLFAALNPVFQNTPGAYERRTKFGIEIGYGGPGRYADGGRATIADIAAFHNEGAGRLPRRQIIVQPSRDVLRGMAADMERAMGGEIKGG